MTGENNKIFKLLSHAVRDGNVFLPNDKLAEELVQDCFELYSRDNVCTTMDNLGGALCSTYPVHLIIPLKQKGPGEKEHRIDENLIECEKKELKNLVVKGRFARTRGRFPAPVLLVGDKFVCRSSTLARSPEIYTRTGYQYFIQGEVITPTENGNGAEQNGISSNGSLDGVKSNPAHPVNGHTNGIGVHYNKNGDKQSEQSVVMNGSVMKKQRMQSSMSPVNGAGQNKEWLLDKMRNTDIDILHKLRVNCICDLMVENKKVKYGMSVTSSEKVDRQNRYSDFDLISIPYPGCEFFADYTNNNYTGVGLKFDWKQNFVDAELQVPDNIANLRGVQWKEYMHWDLVKLTQNYLKLLLNCLVRPCSSGMLLHCISGWDRTPLFISLLRLSLWADGLIHQSLNAEEVVYLTLAYDWLLFSHQFVDRIDKSEEIMHFCFDFLKDITSAEFSLLPNINGLENPFLAGDNEVGSEEMFPLENDIIQHTLDNNGPENGNAYSDDDLPLITNGIGNSENAKMGNGNHKHQCGHGSNDETIFELQEVQTCIECILNNIPEDLSSEFTCEHNKTTVTDNGNYNYSDNSTSDATVNGDTYATPNNLDSSAAVLPLSCSNCSAQNENTGESKCMSDSHHSLKAELGKAEEQKAEPSVFCPRSALSSSFETAKNYISLAGAQQSGPGHLQKGNCMSNSFDFPSESMSTTRKSDPISVPIHCKKTAALSMDGISCNSVSSSLSNAPVTAEPGSSWQMISSPVPHDAIDVNSSTPSGAPSSRNSSFTTSCNGAPETEILKLRLEKRKEKLIMAHNAMIPAYCAVVQRQKQQESGGTFSTIIGNLVQFVKRS